MGQKGVLLAFVEAVHLVDKDEGALGLQACAGMLGALDRLADVLDTAEHRADADELGLKPLCHQAGDGGFAHPRGPPEDAAVWLTRFESQAQGHAGPEQMLLPHHLPEVLWAQAFGQRHGVGQRSHGRPLAQDRMMSAPAGGRKTNRSGGNAGLASKSLRRSTDR